MWSMLHAMATLFTSDTHFGDRRVLNLHPRPFDGVAEMDAELVRRWNQAAGPDDVVWHLGDFARTSRLACDLLPRLNGIKHLLAGNNDQSPHEGWASVSHYREIEVEGARLVLCHYPFRTWNDMHKGALNLHGHSHGRLAPMRNQHDVGVDARDFRPVRLSELRVNAGRTARPAS